MTAYCVRPAASALDLDQPWESPFWTPADTLDIDQFLPRSGNHRPQSRCRLLYTESALAGIFQVRDRFVRCVRTRYFDEVWKDSCVEFFVQPKPRQGYFNFEFNCGGAFLCCYITDPERTAGGFKEFVKLPAEHGRMIRSRPSLPARTEPELVEPVTWTLAFLIPRELLETYVGNLGKFGGQLWRGNFYKCADESSHPHRAAWSPVDEHNFHRPGCFGELRFA